MKLITALCCAGILYTFCFMKCERGWNYEYKKVWGWRPVIATDTSWKQISYSATADSNHSPGNIYVYQNWILQSEVGKGVHIIDNSVPANAHKIGFIRIPGNNDFSIKNNLMYANNYYDMVSIDISRLPQISVVNRMPNMFVTAQNINYKWEVPDSSGYYQCTNSSYSIIITGWVRDSIYPTCVKP